MFKFNEYIVEKNMLGLANLKKRLNYYGGNQQQRFINDKLRGLKRSLLYSYQAATAILPNGKEFRCLINPDKNKPAYDNKILSIPYEDICLNEQRMGKTSRNLTKTNVKPGDVFEWKETHTHWLVYLQAIEQDAYFRSQIRRCDQQIEVDGNNYWVYIRGPVQTSIEWTQKAGVEWNTLNYSLVMYITADETTNNYFHRFKTVKVIDPRYNSTRTWQVVGVDPYYGDGILQIFLDEYYENSIEDAVAAYKKSQEPEPDPCQHYEDLTPKIEGPTQVHQYSRAYYSIKNAENGHWYALWDGKEQDLDNTLNIISFDFTTRIKGTFTLIYRRQNQEDVTLDVKIVSM